MKKKFFLGVFALALLATAGFGVKKSMMSSDAGLSDLALANVEALAQENGEVGGITCNRYCAPNALCWRQDWNYHNHPRCYFSGWMKDKCLICYY